MAEPIRRTHVYACRWREKNIRNIWIGVAAFLSAWVVHAFLPALVKATTFVLTQLGVNAVDTAGLENYLSVYMGAPTAIVFWAAYSKLVDEYLWRISVFGRWLWHAPNLTGTWWGNTHGEGYAGDFVAAISIMQTGTEISVVQFTSESHSWSSMAVFLEGKVHMELVYRYWNEPYEEFKGTADGLGTLRTPHEGLARLELHGANEFEGSYYTRPDDYTRKQHYGKMNGFRRISTAAARNWKHAQELHAKLARTGLPASGAGAP